MTQGAKIGTGVIEGGIGTAYALKKPNSCINSTTNKK